jgi:F-type H+-transporting ATPase subunit b
MNINLTLFGQMISFAIFIWFSMKFVWPPILQALEERKSQIADGLAQAERGQHAQEIGQKHAKELLQKTKAQTAEMISSAQKRAIEIVEEAKNEARAESERILTTARADVEREHNRVKDQLQEQISRLALAAAEKILRREIDPAGHQDLLNTVIEQI